MNSSKKSHAEKLWKYKMTELFPCIGTFYELSCCVSTDILNIPKLIIRRKSNIRPDLWQKICLVLYHRAFLDYYFSKMLEMDERSTGRENINRLRCSWSRFVRKKKLTSTETTQSTGATRTLQHGQPVQIINKQRRKNLAFFFQKNNFKEAMLVLLNAEKKFLNFINHHLCRRALIWFKKKNNNVFYVYPLIEVAWGVGCFWKG